MAGFFSRSKNACICSTAMEGGPFSGNLLPKLAISHNMAGI